MKKSALVTGSEGFVGRHLVPKLEAAGYEVFRSDKKLGTELRQGAVFPQHVFDVIVHLGANIAPIDERLRGGVAVYDDLELDWLMAKYVEGYPPNELFIYPSSCAVDNLKDPYAWVKLTGERLCRVLARRGVPVTILRPFSGYGSDQSEGYPFGAILGRALRGERPLKIWGSGSQVRDWVHVEDLAGAFMAAVGHAPCGGHHVEIGTGVGTTLRRLAEMVARAVSPKAPLPVVCDLYKPESSWERVANSAFATSVWGWRPAISLPTGIAMSVVDKLKSELTVGTVA